MLQLALCLIFGRERNDLQPSQQALVCIPSVPMGFRGFTLLNLRNSYLKKINQGLAVFSELFSALLGLV